MGFRINLYCVPKATVERYRYFTEEDYNNAMNNDTFFDELEKNMIAFDVLTDIICNDRENKLSTPLFKNKLEIESDMYFGTISKEQLIDIIEEVRVNHILKWYEERAITDKGVGDVLETEALKATQGEWNIKANKWRYKYFGIDGKPHYSNINTDVENKWEVSGSWSYEYFIFDLIHILKIFDWDNNVIICIGS